MQIPFIFLFLFLEPLRSMPSPEESRRSSEAPGFHGNYHEQLTHSDYHFVFAEPARSGRAGPPPACKSDCFACKTHVFRRSVALAQWPGSDGSCWRIYAVSQFFIVQECFHSRTISDLLIVDRSPITRALMAIRVRYFRVARTHPPQWRAIRKWIGPGTGLIAQAQSVCAFDPGVTAGDTW